MCEEDYFFRELKIKNFICIFILKIIKLDNEKRVIKFYCIRVIINDISSLFICTIY